MTTGGVGYKPTGKELQKLVPTNRDYLRLKCGFVEMPRTWYAKTTIACLVNMCCGYRQPIVEAEYLKLTPSEPVSVLRKMVYERASAMIEEECQAIWAHITEQPIDVTRTDRRGRYLPRLV